MTIRQLTKPNQPDLERWHAEALNDPGLHQFLALGAYRDFPSVPDGDWTRAVFADHDFRTVMSLNFDRECKAAAVCIWSLNLPGREFRAARMFQYLFEVCPRRYDLHRITFVVSGANRAWNEALHRRFPDCLWGINPEQAYNTADGKMYPTYHYSVPVTHPRVQPRKKP